MIAGAVQGPRDRKGFSPATVQAQSVSHAKRLPAINMCQYLECLNAMLESFVAIHLRRMFGRHGIFHKRLMFGLVTGDVL